MPKYSVESLRRTIQEVKSVEGTMKGREYRKFLRGLYELEKEMEANKNDNISS